MTSPIPSEAYESAAVKVFKNISLRINERLEVWDFAIGVSIVDKLLEFLRKNRDNLGDLSFLFELRQTVFPGERQEHREPELRLVQRALRIEHLQISRVAGFIAALREA